MQDRRVEVFGEPAVDRCEQFAGLSAFALVALDAGEVDGGAYLPELGGTHHIDGRVPGIVHGEFGMTASERGERGEAI